MGDAVVLRACVVSILVILPCTFAKADEVILTDGSRLIGQVQKLHDGKLTLKTELVGDLAVDVARVQGISTETPLTVQMKTGERAIGTLEYTPQSGQRILAEVPGTMALKLHDVAAMWPPDQVSPEVAELQTRLAKAESPWSLRLEGGVDGQTGNTERVALNGRADVRRTTERERLLLYSQVRFAHENGEDTVREVLGGVNLEADINRKWFGFAKLELEYDKFENLDMRTTASAGVGYFAIREPDQELKFRGGLGYQHESFRDGTSDDQAIAELGMDYRKELAPWLLFKHATTYYPTFETSAITVSSWRMPAKSRWVPVRTGSLSWACETIIIQSRKRASNGSIRTTSPTS